MLIKNESFFQKNQIPSFSFASIFKKQESKNITNLFSFRYKIVCFQVGNLFFKIKIINQFSSENFGSSFFFFSKSE